MSLGHVIKKTVKSRKKKSGSTCPLGGKGQSKQHPTKRFGKRGEKGETLLLSKERGRGYRGKEEKKKRPHVQKVKQNKHP